MLLLGFRSSGRLPDGVTGPGRRLWMAGGAAEAMRTAAEPADMSVMLPKGEGSSG
jgi:hypothetical protein